MAEMSIVLRDQEVEGSYIFRCGKHYMTRGFINFFSKDVKSHEEKVALASNVAGKMLDMISSKYGVNADYLQVFDCTYGEEKQKVYVIHDVSHVTFLLSEEY